MRRRLEELGAPVPRFAEVTDVADVDAFAARVGGPIVVKTARGGYDGRGVTLAADSPRPATSPAATSPTGPRCCVEERVDMRRELSALVARSPFGQGAAWPVVETVQRDGICVEVHRARARPGRRARQRPPSSSALRLADELGVVGVLAVELFETVDGGLLVNELAMRPHNSGHWTMDGARHQPVRAAPARGAGLSARANRADRAGDGDGQRARCAAGARDDAWTSGCTTCSRGMPEAKVHLYGKAERPGRKIGHVNVLGAADGSLDDAAYVADVRERAVRAAHWLSHGEWTDGWDGHGMSAQGPGSASSWAATATGR